MTLILCLDNQNGMAFNGRRQSADRVLRSRMLQHTSGQRLWMSAYSAAQFDPTPGILVADDDFLFNVGAEDACFAEIQNPSAHIKKFDKLIIYRWNKHYPADMYFDISLVNEKWKLSARSEFVGSSHACIIEEIYESI